MSYSPEHCDIHSTSWLHPHRSLILVGPASTSCNGTLREKLLISGTVADRLTYVAVSIDLVAIGLIATILPARRAGSIDLCKSCGRLKPQK